MSESPNNETPAEVPPTPEPSEVKKAFSTIWDKFKTPLTLAAGAVAGAVLYSLVTTGDDEEDDTFAVLDVYEIDDTETTE
jgi:hypothetical protein